MSLLCLLALLLLFDSGIFCVLSATVLLLFTELVAKEVVAEGAAVSVCVAVVVVGVVVAVVVAADEAVVGFLKSRHPLPVGLVATCMREGRKVRREREKGMRECVCVWCVV